jgi:molybdate transport system substrate-binding protein
LVLVVPTGNAASVSGVTDLADVDLKVAVCAAELPCGKLANKLAQLNGITLAPDTLEVGGSPGIVTKAAAGEIDVGLVLATDVTIGGDKVAVVPIAPDQTIWSDVSAAPIAAGTNQGAAAAFLAFLESPAGQQLASEAGISAR